ncbi:MAG: FMN-binding protein [Spirochaetia bacterium]
MKQTKQMKQTIITGGKLAIICACAAIVLGFINAMTEPVIAENKREELRVALAGVAGDQEVGERNRAEENGTVQGYYPVDGDGYILELRGLGYGGDMQILAGFRRDGRVFSVVLLENQETPGLGKKAEDPAYMERFIGKGGDEPVPVRKDDLTREQADSISGATLTFAGIANALAEGSEFVKSIEEGAQ